MKKLLFTLLLLPCFCFSQMMLINGFYHIPSFAPTDTLGCLIYMNPNILGLSNNDPVSSLTDLSGNCNHALQSSSGLKPIFKTNQIDGKPSIRFDGTDDVLEISNTSIIGGNSGLSFFVVVKETGVGTNQAILTKWDYNTQGTLAFQTDDVTGPEVMCYIANACNDAGTNTQHSTNASLTTNFYLLEVIYDGSQSNTNRVKIYKNSTLLSMSNTGTFPTTLTSCSATMKLGMFGGGLTRYLNGEIAMIIMYDHALTSIGRTTVEYFIHRQFPSLY